MPIAAVAVKAKTALTYCCVGALSIGAHQAYEKRVAPKKPRAYAAKVVKRKPAAAAATPIAAPAPCLPSDLPPIVAPGERLNLATSRALPPAWSASFFPVPSGGGFVVAGPAPGARLSGPAAEVPEPAALGLFGVGAALLAWRRRRSR